MRGEKRLTAKLSSMSSITTKFKAYLVKENTPKLLRCAFWALTLNVPPRRVDFQHLGQTQSSKLRILLKSKVKMKSSQETYLHFKNVRQLWAVKFSASKEKKKCYNDGETSWGKLILISLLVSTSSTLIFPISLSVLISLKSHTFHLSPAYKTLCQKLSRQLFLQVH